MYLEISREFLSCNWKYWSSLPALTTVSLYTVEPLITDAVVKGHLQ
jgi:hypothetical protein